MNVESGNWSEEDDDGWPLADAVAEYDGAMGRLHGGLPAVENTLQGDDVVDEIREVVAEGPAS